MTRHGRSTTADDSGAGRSWPARLVGLAAGLALAAAVAVRVGRRRTERATDRLVSELLSAATGPPADAPAADAVTDGDLADLPAPVRRYLDAVLEEGHPRIRTVRLSQRGEFRMGEEYRPLTAVQHVSVDPPGFVWDARIEALPRIPVRVVDAYVGGEGSLQAKVLSVLPVVDAPPGPGMDEGELARYLAEGPWYPTALLDDRVEWEAVDDRAARATVEDRGRTASLVFHFDDRDLVERVHSGARYRQETDDYAPWTGRFGDYRVRNGVLVPTSAEVGWDEEAESYWRATVESIEYGVATPRDGSGDGGGDPAHRSGDGEEP